MSETFHENVALALLVAAAAGSGIALVFLFGQRRLHERSRSRWLPVLVANALGAALASSLLALGGELYFRFAYDTTDAFGVTKVTRRWLRRHFQLNAAGMRDDLPAYPAAVSPVRRRLTLLGDSFTAGYGVAAVRDRFANRIRRERPDLEVHVLAENGWNTGAHLDVLVAHQEYEIDTVVLVYGLNDITDIDPRWQRMRDRLHEEGQPRTYLAQHSYFVNWLHYRFIAWRDSMLHDYFRHQLDAYSGALWDEQRRRLAELRQTVDRRGGQLLVVTFPLLHALGPDYAFAPVHERLGEFWREQGVPHLDLRAAFDGADPDELVVNAYDSHPNERAHALAADAILAFLAEHAGRGRWTSYPPRNG